ncbi:hypothetical protein [Ravibacter arvi]
MIKPDSNLLRRRTRDQRTGPPGVLSTWTTEKIVAAMHAGKERTVRLKYEEQLPVVIGYFTEWVGADGKLDFGNDVYGHDWKTAARYFAVRPAIAQ